MLPRWENRQPREQAHSAPILLVELSRASEHRPTRGLASLRFDVGRSDHLAPFLSFFDYELKEVGGRATEGSATRVRKLRLHVGVGQTSINRRIELIDYFFGRASG